MTPDEPLVLVGLFFAAMLTAGLSAVVGMGGGVTLVGVMSLLLPAPVVIPVHAVVQLALRVARYLSEGLGLREEAIAVLRGASLDAEGRALLRSLESSGR